MLTRLVSLCPRFSPAKLSDQCDLPPFAELVHEALQSLISLRVVLSRVDRRVNINKKGKSREQEEPAAAASLPEVVEQDDEQVDTTPADGVSDLPPAPTPAGLVPSSALPSKPAAPRVSYDLPEGVEIQDCAIFYLGAESLGLNNLLMTHGKCSASFVRLACSLRGKSD